MWAPTERISGNEEKQLRRANITSEDGELLSKKKEYRQDRGEQPNEKRNVRGKKKESQEEGRAEREGTCAQEQKQKV